MPFGRQQLDGPPPNPVTFPPAARESSQLGVLTGGNVLPFQRPGLPPGPAGPGAPPVGMGMPPGPAGAPGGMPGAAALPGPGGMPSSGPDLSGLMALGAKIDEAILTLAGVMPDVAAQLDQARELIANAVAGYLQQVGTVPGIGAGLPGGTAGMPRGGGMVQAGNQFPGGGFGAGRVA